MKRLVYLFLLLSIFIWTDERAIKLNDFSKESRVALIIGNSNYTYNPLKNPINDATDMAAALEKLDFDVTLHTDLDRKSMAKAIKDFGKKIRNGGVALFYFAGHGVQVDGINYLIPVNADIISELDVEFEGIEAQRILSEMEVAGNKMNIIILDSCRNNPFESASRSGNYGLARMDAPQGSLLVYSTSPGKTALDGEGGRNGVFTGSLLTELDTNPSINLAELLIKVRNRVIAETDGLQVPWESSSLTGQFYFKASEVQSVKGDDVEIISFKEYKATTSNLKDIIKNRAEYRTLLEKEYVSIVELEGSSYITSQEKLALWQDFINRFPDDNNYIDIAYGKIEFWQEDLDKVKVVKKPVDKRDKWIFYEDFSDNSNDWSIADEYDYTLDVNYGNYYIYDEYAFRKTWIYDTLYDYEDFELTTEIRRLGGIDNNGLNVIFGMDNSGDRYYTFGYTANGYYSIYKYDNGWNTIVPWTKSNVIDSYSNKLSIIREYGVLYFYINDTYLTYMLDYDWFGPAIGFGINSQIEAEVEYLYISRRDDSSYSVFEESFEDNDNGWVEMDYEEQYLDVKDSAYYIYNANNFQKVWQRGVIEDESLFSIEADIQKLYGSDDKGMNLIFAADNETEKYLAFGISGNGQYIVSIYDEGWFDYIPWTQSKYINRFNSINRVKIVKIDSSYYFYINGHYVDKLDFVYDWYGPAVGLGINPDIEVKLNRLAIYGYNDVPPIQYRDRVVTVEDQFSNNKYQWRDDIDTESEIFKIEDGLYTMYNRDYFDYQYQYNGVTFMEEDYEVEATMKKSSGRDNNILGILFNISLDGKTYYTFGYSNNGMYALFEYDNQWNTLIPWTDSSAIFKDEFNNLKVVRIGDQLDFYINGTYVDSYSGFISDGVDFGIGAASDIKVQVENFKVTKINLP